MAKHDKSVPSVDNLYRKGRYHRSGEPSNHAGYPAHHSPPSCYDHDPNDGALRNNRPQDIENQPDHGTTRGEHLSDPSKSKSWNDVTLSDWRRSGVATDKPCFDKGNAWRQKDGSIHSDSGPDDRTRVDAGRNRKPEPNTNTTKRGR